LILIDVRFLYGQLSAFCLHSVRFLSLSKFVNGIIANLISPFKKLFQEVMMKKNISVIVIIVVALLLIIFVIAFTNARIKKLEQGNDKPGRAQTELSIIKTR